MAFFRKGRNANFSILNGYSWYVPGIGGIAATIGWFFLGVVLAQIITFILLAVGATGNFTIGLDYLQLITYPVMFIPPVLAAKFISNRNQYFEDGYKVNTSIAGGMKPVLACLLCCLGTFALAWVADLANLILPPMPESLENIFDILLNGDFFISFISVSIFAPFFEEWLLRGIILRGLLNCKRADGRRGYSPFWSIIVTALIFAIIHFNIWQAIPAFMLGCLFGYVYYKTGSLLLTMLMHFFNNTVSLVTSHLIDSDQGLQDIIPDMQYYAITAACIAIVVLVVYRFSKIKTSRQGACELIPAATPSEVPLP